MIQILPRNRLLIDIFGKILYIFGSDRYRARVAHMSRGPIYICLCTVLVTLPRLGQISEGILMIPEPCSTHQYLYARWSTFSDWFHNVSFTMQPHDQNWSLSLTVSNASSFRNLHHNRADGRGSDALRVVKCFRNAKLEAPFFSSRLCYTVGLRLHHVCEREREVWGVLKRTLTR